MQIIISIINYNKTVYLVLMQLDQTTRWIKPFNWSQPSDWLTRSLIMWFNELLVIIHCYTHVTSRLLVNIIIADHQIELKVWIWTFSPLTIVNWFISHSWSPENLWPHILLYFITITSGLVENYPDFEFTLLASANYMCLSSQYC